MTSRPNRILVIVLGAVALLAVAAGILAATRSVPEYDAGTPEGVVQDYVTAVIDEDLDEAADLLSDESGCTSRDLDQLYAPDEVRVLLRDSDVDGDRARVKVEIVMSGGDLFDSSEYSEEHTFELTETGDGWLISRAPWPMYECGMEP